jgi:hypothetical protein
MRGFFFSRAVRAALFSFSAGQQGSGWLSKIMQYFRANLIRFPI